MEGHPYHHQQLQLQQQVHHQQRHNNLSVNYIEAATSFLDRYPQWSVQETKELLMIRGELDGSFMETKRNKLLWELISTKMKARAYNRTADQCKCKWKNLVTRYKGYETMESEAMRQQFPFYSELQAIFAARMLWVEAAEGGSSSSKKIKVSSSKLSSDDDDVTEFGEAVPKGGAGGSRKKMKKLTSNTSSSTNNNLVKLLDKFMKQQQEMEIQWREAFEAREKERRMKEMEWRQTMEALENERVLMDRRWREREEQRRMREEARAQNRDAIITALLNKLTREDNII